jgi:hypothetical protein
MGEEVKKVSNKNLIIGIIVVAIIIIILFVPMIPVDVTYSETEPYNRLATYEVISATLKENFEWFGKWVYHRSTVVVKNTDSHGGTFTIKHYIYDVNGLLATKTSDEYIDAGNTVTSNADFDTQWLQDVRGEYSVTAPTVIDQRVVTKHKTIYRSIIEILIYG